MSNQARRRAGFTIVELLIVVVVIAILAAISIVAYTNIQQRARDSVRKADVATIEKALKLYAVDNGPMYVGSGCGYAGNGSGWFNYPYGSPGEDMNVCLKNQGYMTETVKDPHDTFNCTSGTQDCRKYAKYTCLQGGVPVTYVYANLETKAQTSTDTDGTCDANLDANFGFNYYVKF